MADDPTRTFTLEQFEQNLDEDIPEGTRVLFGLTSFARRRGEVVSGQLSGDLARSNGGMGSCEASFGQGGGQPGGGQAPAACERDADCEGSCPVDLGACVCASMGAGASRCLPGCTQDSDCPAMMGTPLVCGPSGYCVR